MKHLIIAILFLLPISVSAQLLRAYGVVEIGSTFPTSSITGAKFAYRVTDSSYYRWIHTNVWVKILESSIDPDTLYLKQLSGTTALVDGDTIDISTYFLKSDTTSAFASYLKRPVGWGLSLLTGKYPFVDSSKVASRYYAGTNPTTIAANYAAVSNGTNLIARNLFDNNTYAGVISRPWKFGEYTTAGLPTGVTGYTVYNTTINGLGWYDGTRWNYVPKADRSAFTSGSIPFTNSSGQFTENNSFRLNTTDIQVPYHWRPETDNTYDLGLSNRRWRNIYSILVQTDRLQIATVETVGAVPWISSTTGIGQTNGFYFNPATGGTFFLATGARAQMRAGVIWNYFDNHYFGISTGVVTGSSSEKVQIQGDQYTFGAIKNQGTIYSFGTTGTTPVSGAGTRLMWIPSKFAFRAGHVTGTQWNADSIGNYSVAMGLDTKAKGGAAFAMGDANSASAVWSAALGGRANMANGLSSGIFGGSGNTTTKSNSFIGGGENNTASEVYASVLGGRIISHQAVIP